MATFAYRGRSTAGAVTGQIDAPDRRAAVQELRAKGVIATSVQERRARASVGAKLLGRRARDRDLAVYTRQFSTMIDAGLPIAQCLNILAEQSESSVLKAVTKQVTREVEGGTPLAEAFRKHPRTFDDIFTNMIEVGESGGVLDVVLQRLSTYIERAAALKRKVKGAMVYPLTIVSVAVLVIIFMMTFVIPTFAHMFTTLGAELPLPTRIVLWVSDFTRRFVLLMIAMLAATIFIVRRYYRTEQGSAVIDSLFLRLPGIGTLVRKVAVARFTRTLGTLIFSGVPILEGLRITARSSGNRVVERAVMQARAAVTTGRSLADPLGQSGVFPPMVVHMISVGESTGALDQMLNKIADFYDDEVDSAVNTLTSLLEPAMIVFLGVIVGGLVVAMYLPIFRMVTLIK